MKKNKTLILLVEFPIILSSAIFIILVFIWLKSAWNYVGVNTDSGWRIYHNVIGRNAFISVFEWDGNYDNMTISVPDSYKNYHITTLGGYSGNGGGARFGVILPEEYGNDGETPYDPIETPEWYPYGYTIIDIKFILNIAQNINEIELVDKDYRMDQKADGLYLLYHPVYYINCSQKNKTFYSKDGRLYYKANNILVDAFAYPTNN